jgi:hypothetical protein
MEHRYTVNGTILPYEVIEYIKTPSTGARSSSRAMNLAKTESVKDRAYRHVLLHRELDSGGELL